MFEWERIDHVALSVRDVERSAAWYIEVLGLKHLHQGMWDGVPVFVGNDRGALALFPTTNGEHAEPEHRHASSILHFALRVDRVNFELARQHLTACGIETEFQDHGISQSIYFRDLDGHEVEITTYDIAP